jgi:sigma-E factor negative regulatory protein RseA
MDPLKEQLSAFLDGELPEAETELFLKRLERDEELATTLSRFSLIGAAMRSESGSLVVRPVAARVSAALAHEPALAPGVIGRNWRRPLAGVAVAASVALAAVLLAGQASLRNDAAQVTVAATVPAANPALPAPVAQVATVAAAYEEPEPLPAGYTTPPAPEGNIPPGELANFLVAHSEQASFVSRRSVVTSLLTEPPPVDRPVEPAQ